MPKVVIKGKSIAYQVRFVEDENVRILFIEDADGNLREAGKTTRRKTEENGTRIYFTWKDGEEHHMPYHTVADVVRFYGPTIQKRWLETFSDETIGQNFKEAYGFTCPQCGHKAYAKPSVLMLFGINMGGGFCTKCETRIHLRIDAKNEAMVATIKEPTAAGGVQ